MPDSPEFIRAVVALRALPQPVMLLCLHAAMFWDNREFIERTLAAKVDDYEIRGTIQ